jgi:hypothetical protein
VTDDVQRELLSIYASFPGIVTPTNDVRGSHLHLPVEGADDEGVVAVMSFETSSEGRAAELVVDFIMTRVGAKKDTGLACSCPADGAVFYGCTEKQLELFARYLDYASHRPMGHARPKAALSPTPLSVLLSHAFTAFARDFRSRQEAHANAGEGINPHLGIWSNVLRFIGDEGLDQRQLRKLAILSRRALRVAVRNAQEQGWLTVENVPEVRGLKMLRLTAQGRQAREAGGSFIDEAEGGWRGCFGHDRVDALRASLAALAGQFEIELPCYLTGYGPADPHITGGTYVAEQLGPPRIPAHGQEWPVVLRDPKSDVSDLPLPALMSKVLAAFTIDYERERLGWLATSSRFLQFVDDDGTTLGQVSSSGVNGTGKSLLERHLVVVVEPGRPGDMNRRVHLTPKGRRGRDSYPYLVMEIERNWRSRYGADHLVSLRTALESLDRDFDAGLPDYPDTTAWFFRWRWQDQAD